MSQGILSSKQPRRAVCSMVFASLFVFSGLLCPIFHSTEESPNQRALLAPIAFAGAVFLVAHVLACVILSESKGGVMGSARRALRMACGSTAMAFMLLVFWDLAEWVRP